MINLVAARREAGVPLRRLIIDRESLDEISPLELDRLRERLEVNEDDEWCQWLRRETEIDNSEMQGSILHFLKH